MKALEARVPPVVVFLLAMGIIEVSAKLAPAWGIAPSFWSKVAVGVFLVAGGIFGSAGVAQFLQAKTTVHPNHPERASQLVTGGVYRITRNPMYLGLVCLLLAYGAHKAHASVLVAVGLFGWFITRFQIVPEERALIANFGQTYLDYAQRVRRWL